MAKTYTLIKKDESFIGKDGKPVSTTGFYLKDEYGEEIKVTNVFKRDYYRLNERADYEEIKK